MTATGQFKLVHFGKRSVDFLLKGLLVTARKRSFGQGNVFTPSCLFTRGGGQPTDGGGGGLPTGGLPTGGGCLTGKGVYLQRWVLGRPPGTRKAGVRILLE